MKFNFTVPWNLEEQKTKTEFEFPIPVKSVPLPDENLSSYPGGAQAGRLRKLKRRSWRSKP